MTMESSKKYFDKCLNCNEYYARHISTIELCEPCVEFHTQEMWGIGVPTEQYLHISTHLRMQCVPDGGGSNEILPPQRIDMQKGML